MTAAPIAHLRLMGLFEAAPQRSVFGRLRLVLSAVFLGGSAAALAGVWFFSTTAANQAYDRLLISAAVQIAETISIEDNQLSADPPDAAFQTLALAPDDRLFYAVYRPDGTVLTGYSGLGGQGQGAPVREAPQIADARFAGAAVRTVTIGRHITTPDGGGWCRVVVAQTRLARQAVAWGLMAKTGSLVILVGCLGFFGSLAAARRALLPLARIEQALAARDVHDVSPLEVDSPRETQALVDAINMVMARFADRMGKLRAMTAVAAHQIRTPLAALAAQIELLDAPAADRARQARIDRIRARVAELGRLTNQLLGHAMISSRAELVPHTSVDLRSLARNALDNGVPLSLDRDLTVAFNAPETPVIVRGDPVNLQEGLTNLVHNAATHGAPTRLEVRVGVKGEAAYVAVRDDGPGIPPSQWDAVLTPYAVPRERSCGAGLGLAIVHEIARAHAGELVFRLPEGGGFEVRFEMPRADVGA